MASRHLMRRQQRLVAAAREGRGRGALKGSGRSAQLLRQLRADAVPDRIDTCGLPLRFVVGTFGVAFAIGVEGGKSIGCLAAVGLEVMDSHALAAAVLGAVRFCKTVADLQVRRVLLPSHVAVPKLLG